MKKINLYFLLLFILFSCIDNGDLNTEFKIEKLTGQVQKGPFNNGTSVSISELTLELAQTGRVFKSEINNNRGEFEISNLTLESPFVIVEANGFYFNECTGKNSEAPLVLSAISDIKDQSALNVNILSHLEKDRVLKLVDDGASFMDAKVQAQNEILAIFEMDENADTITSEQLSIIKEGNENAKLLAISSILQVANSTSDLSQLIADIKTDLLEDGVLDQEAIGVDLITRAMILNVSKVRSNLIAKYESESEEVVVPNFEKYIQQFIDNSSYEPLYLFTYPEQTNYGTNILKKDVENIDFDINYSMAANMNSEVDLKIVISGGLWYYLAMPNAPVGWEISTYNTYKKEQVFTSKSGTDFCNLTIFFPNIPDNNIITVDYYEGNMESPTFTKQLLLGEPDFSASFNFPNEGLNGENVFNIEEDTLKLEPDTKYCFEFDLLDELEISSLIRIRNTDTSKVKIDKNDIVIYELEELVQEKKFSVYSNIPQKYSASFELKDHGTADLSAHVSVILNDKIFLKDMRNKVIIW